jgi:hypothetical protein
MGGGHSQTQGWTQLSPHPRPPILRVPPTAGFTLHVKVLTRDILQIQRKKLGLEH